MAMTLTTDFMTDFTANTATWISYGALFLTHKVKLQGIFKNCRGLVSLQGLDYGSCIKLESGYHHTRSNGRQWKLNVV